MARGRGRTRQRIKIEVPVYGNIQFKDCEMDALALPPKHAEFEKIKQEKLKHQRILSQTKTRWGWKELVYDLEGNLNEKLYDREGKLVVEMEDVQEEQEIREQEYREVYSPEEHSVDFGKLRPTDVKSNPRVCMPKPGNAQQETELMFREMMTEKVIAKYLDRQR